MPAGNCTASSGFCTAFRRGALCESSPASCPGLTDGSLVSLSSYLLSLNMPRPISRSEGWRVGRLQHPSGKLCVSVCGASADQNDKPRTQLSVDGERGARFGKLGQGGRKGEEEEGEGWKERGRSKRGRGSEGGNEKRRREEGGGRIQRMSPGEERSSADFERTREDSVN